MAFMVLTNSGHIAIAKSIKDQQLYLAWGDLPSYLSPPGSITATEVSIAGTLLTGAYTYEITSFTDAGETTPSTPVNVSLNSAGNSITLSWSAVSGASGYNIYGRTVANGYKYLATVTSTTWTDIGSAVLGSASAPTTNTTSADPWTTTPPSPAITMNGLFNELGRRKVGSVQYVVPDSNGPYVTNQGRWSTSTIPTKYIYAYIAYDLTDAPNNTIYQYGLYVGTVPVSGYENAQYLLPTQVATKGSLLSIENISPIFRNSSTREFYEIVMTF